MSGGGEWRLVARREFVERIRDRGFQISTLITILILSGFIVGNAIFNKGTQFDLGLVGAGAQSIGARTAEAAKAQGVDVKLRTIPSETLARRAVQAGDVDAAVFDSATIVVKSDPPEPLVSLIQAASASERAARALTKAGLSPDQIRSVMNPAPVPVHSLQPPDPRAGEHSTAAFIGVLLLYGQVFSYGYWVAGGVVEEKASRVVELLLSAIRPSSLLRGKILGIGTLAILQLFLFGAWAIGLAIVVGAVEFPATLLGIAAVVLGWFVLGFAFYSSLFAVAGAVVSRQEELQNTATPLNLVVVFSFFASISAAGNPQSTFAMVASFLPFSAPLVMPVRIASGEVPASQILASIAIMVGCTAALIPVAARIYEGAVLRTGARVRLRDAWRARARAES